VSWKPGLQGEIAMTTRLGSFAQVGAPVGLILANLAFLLMSASTQPDEFMQWGWPCRFS